MALEVIILAAGQGTRMRSSTPKVLHPVGGRPMLARVIDTALALSPERIHVVIGAGAEQVRSTISSLYASGDISITFAVQEQQLGTGHAVQQAFQQASPAISENNWCLTLNGDAPLLDIESLRNLQDKTTGDAALGILTAEPDDPTGLGRIIRDQAGNVSAIVEQRDTTEAQRKIAEINSGIMLGEAGAMAQWLDGLRNDNSQGEFYLTDIVSQAVAEGSRVRGVLALAPRVLVGVNSRVELAAAERLLQRMQADQLLEQGVTLADPARIDIRGTLKHGMDCRIDVNVIFEGDVVLGDNVSIGPGCVVRDSMIGDNCRIEANCIVEQANLDSGCNIGPFARLRPGTRFDSDVRIGNFVEVKNATFGNGSKANHLAYVGDSTVGKNVNIGAGVITCNYDGANKHQTVIGDNVFVGSDSQLVAPVKIGDGATVGAGTTVTREVAADSLAITRAPRKSIPDWNRPVKKPKTSE